MAATASRSSLPYLGSLVQNISGPLSPDTGYISKASGLLYQDIGISSKSKLPLSRAFGIIPHGIGYGLGPFGPSLAKKTGYLFMNTMTSGPVQPLRNTSSSNRLRPELIRDQGSKSCIPEELALLLFQALDPAYTARYTHMDGFHRYHGPLYKNPGPFFRSFRFSSPANNGIRFNQFIKEAFKPRRTGHLGKYGSGLNGQDPGQVKRKLLEFSPSLIELCGGSEGDGVNACRAFQGRGNLKGSGSGSVGGYTQGSGPGERKRKRAVDGDEENEGSSPPPPSKRIDRDSPKPPTLRLACPLAKAAPDIHLGCLLIGRKNLSGIKEHLKRNHFGKKLPDDIRAAKTWNDVFDVCNPQWRQTQRPSPYLEPRKFLANSSALNDSPTKSSEQQNYVAFSSINHQKVYNGVEFCSPPPSTNSVSPRNGTFIYNGRENSHQYNGAAPSPISCSHRSDRGSFSAPVEGLTSEQSNLGIGFPSTGSSDPLSWLADTTTPARAQRNSLESRNSSMPRPNWLPTNGCGEPNHQPNYFIDEFVGTSNSSRNFYDPAPSLINNSNKSFENPPTIDPSHLRYQDFLHSDLHGEASIPWDNSVSPGTVDFVHTPPTPVRVGNTSQDPLQSSTSIHVPPLQPAPKSKREIVKHVTRSHRDRLKRKKYQLIVTRKPPIPSSEEPRRSHRFTFEDIEEFHAEFEHWLQREFTDPPFCWQKMEFLNGLEKARLSNIEDVADNLEVSFIHYRSLDAALYLVAKRSPPEPYPYSPVELNNNNNLESTEECPHRQQQM